MTGSGKRFPVAEGSHGTQQEDDATRALRLLAEARLRTDALNQLEERIAHPSPDEIQQTLHELRVHQIELEMQNEELRRTQSELDASRARWFDLYDMAPVGYCTVDERGLIVQANLTFATLLHVPRSALVHRPFSQFIGEDDQDRYYLLRKQIIADGAPQSCELQMARVDDRPWWAHLMITAALDARCEPELRVVLTDVTARKHAEAAAARLAAQLQHAQKLESVGLLAGGVAHDYNNMLAAILGHAELALLRVDVSPALREDLTEIHRAASRSAELTQQLLTFARKQIIRPQVLDLNATVAHSLKMLRRLIGEQVRFTWNPAADLWPVTMDATQVDQILTNLCLNARDAIGGAGMLVVTTANCVLDAPRCERLPDAVPGEYVQLTVTDSGCGMSRDVLEHIFEPFYTTKRIGEGTGLGLASVFGAVRQNGGFLAVATRPGEGTTFDIYLPRSQGALATLPLPEPAVPLPRGDETILVVEDESAVRRMTVRALEVQGYTVLEADGPHEAIRLAQEHGGGAITLLLTDVQMPEMSGYDLVAALRSARPHLKHLFMSGYPAGHSMNGGAFVGQPEAVAHFLAKPFSLATLGEKVRMVLDGG